MRDLIHPRVLTSATTAALATSLACCPRLVQWTERSHTIWFLIAVLFVSDWVLWAFVLAWHTRYTGRPVVAKGFDLRAFALTAVAGVMVGAAFHFWFDPAIKSKLPEDFPATFQQWVSMTLFGLALQQLFLVFGPLAFFSRLLRNGRIAVVLTLFFSGWIIVMKTQAVTSTMPWGMGFGFLLVRITAQLVTIYLYLRGGIVLAYWWSLLVQSRQLLDLF